MATMAITDQAIRRITPAPGKRMELWDAYVPGFGYRATRAGAGTFFVMFRHNKTQRRQTLGRYPAMTLEAARTAAKAALDDVRQGVDPQAKQASSIAAAETRRARTVALAVADFIVLYPRYRPSTRTEVARLFKREVVPVIGGMPITAVTRTDLAGVINTVADRGRITMANRLHAYLQSFFGWLVMRGELEARPLVNLTKPGPERTRDRVLTDAELAAVWQASAVMGYPFGTAVQLLILTAQRRSEVANMRRSDLDLVEKIWTMPREATKTDRAHTVPLSQEAVDVLSAVPASDSPLVFAAARRRPTTEGKERSISGWSSYKRQLDAKTLTILRESGGTGGHASIVMPGWTLHDLRRTVASGMASDGVAPHVVERLLNHSTGTIRGVAAVYNRHSYAPEMRAAVEAWAKVVVR